MKPFQYGVVGSFALGQNVFGGQSIKTRNFTDELENVIGEGTVLRVDTRGWNKNPIKLIVTVAKAISKSEQIVILPADRGVLVIPRIVRFLCGFCKIKMHYVVIGGWLPQFLEKHKGLIGTLKKYDGIYVETNMMKTALEKMGFQNIVLLPNFKKLNVLDESELVYSAAEPYRVCTFSRVLREKGIEDAIAAVKQVNETAGRTVYTLDIYGKVDAGYEADFETVKAAMPEYVQYKGAVDGSKSTEIIKEYFALLFPTYFYGEGYPGTLLDAFSSGVPVVASDWAYNSELVTGDRGYLYKARDVDALATLLQEFSENNEKISSLKTNCLAYAKEMTPEIMIQKFLGK